MQYNRLIPKNGSSTVRKQYELFLLKSLFVVTLFALFSCHKSGTGNGCDLGGGITLPNTYLFWIDHDFDCGIITVEVKDDQNRIVTPFQDKISYTSPSAPACTNVNYGKYATFDLYPGKIYTYRANCSGKTWTGTISVPCEQNQCENVHLQ